MMRRIELLLVAVLLALLTSAAPAQQPKKVQTVKIHETAPGAETMYQVADDGSVSIDSEIVETVVSTQADKTMLPVARMMLAIRDGKWKPLKQ
jgi:hypothetical protein